MCCVCASPLSLTNTPPNKQKNEKNNTTKHSYPDRARQALFLQHYVAQARGLPEGTPAPLTASELDALTAEADVYALASHIYWGVWAVVQARYSPIDFDYMAYSAQRWAEFRRRRAEFLGRARSVFGGE